MSWPASESQALTTVPTDGVLSYDEGLYVGHRRYDRDGLEPHFAFGHGLGYARWRVVDAGASADADGVTVHARLERESDRPTGTLLQVYLSRPDSSVDRPARWLAGFATIPAASEGAVTTEVVLPREVFRHWAGTWVVEPGTLVVQLGFSSRDLSYRLEVIV
jgi:beta-glucosidase